MVTIASYEEGGPNDPRTSFKGLRELLTVIKDELSPYCWRAYNNDFRERQKAEKKLQGLNKLPGSGAEPQDGVVQGTPLWQERLDKLLLVEHLKTKIMSAHGYFVDSAELFLKCHGWLVKSPLLADTFADCITHVPPSQYERVDLLQIALAASKKETEDLRVEFEDYIVELKKKRERYLQRVVEHQDVALARQRRDQSIVLWSYQVRHGITIRLDETCRTLEARVGSLEASFASRTEELDESRRQWDEERTELTQDRDKFKKLYNKMVKAHEQAMEDLKGSQGSVEDQAKMILVLSTEKSRLTNLVEELEDDKKRLTKQLAEARDEIARMRAEMRGMRQSARETEALLWETRREVEQLEEVQASLEDSLDEAARVEAGLRDDLEVSRADVAAAKARLPTLLEELAVEQRATRLVEAECRDILGKMRSLEEQVVRVIPAWKWEVEAVKARAKKELEDFRNGELQRVKDEFARKMEKILRRNELLEREVATADATAPHLSTLNPLAVDESRICANCRKVFVFEGTIRG